MKFDDLREAWAIVLDDGTLYRTVKNRGDSSFACFPTEAAAKAHARRQRFAMFARVAPRVRVVKLADVGVLAGVPPD